MPVTYFENPSVPLSYEDLTTWAEYEAQGQGSSINQYLAYINQNYPDADLTDFMLEQTGNYLDYVPNGDGTYTVIGAYRDIQNTVQTNPVNSNASQISRGTIRQAINDGVEYVGGVAKRHMTTFPASGSFANKAAYVLGSVGSAIGAVSTGIALGKVIDSALYNANPDFWDAAGMSSLNPETWNAITNGDDSPFAGLFNLILGLDPETGKSQAYLDENAFAYFAKWMAEQGVFAPANREISSFAPGTATYSGITYPILFSGNPAYIRDGGWNRTEIIGSTSGYICGFSYRGNCIYILASETPFNYGVTSKSQWPTDDYTYTASNSASQVTYNNKTFYYGTVSAGQVPQLSDMGNVYLNPVGENLWNNTTARISIAYNMLYSASEAGGVEGISDQEGSTLPSTTNWDTIPNTLTDLQTQYPDLWNNAIAFDNIQPDGTVNRTTYVPVPLPDYQYNNDTQPVSSNLTQTDTQIDPDTLTKTLLQIIANTVTATDTQTETEPVTPPPSNPTDTGEGSSPVPTPPNGSASALWSVYHPTQAQINSFGAWLWSTNFVDQILKVFQNPMDAIISLHKVFIDPVDAGTSTIVAGYLDSQVPSAYVTQQYVYKDCGSVDCHEYFGSVFDYVGTNVSLYLPFIGIVPLNVDEVMRSTINVKYGCDLFTGAILVEVKITRDGNDVVMYQYGGDGGVQYPISGSRSGGFLTGLAATIGAAASVATGGAMLPAAAAALGGSVMSAQKQVQHSGGFSGNSGAMGCKVPYLIIERPQTKVASLMPSLDGYPTNHAIKLSECSGQVVVSSVHVEGVRATKGELVEIENLLKAGILV